MLRGHFVSYVICVILVRSVSEQMKHAHIIIIRK